MKKPRPTERNAVGHSRDPGSGRASPSWQEVPDDEIAALLAGADPGELARENDPAAHRGRRRVRAPGLAEPPATGAAESPARSVAPRDAKRARPQVRLIHVDEHIIVADKPAGVLSTRGRDAAPTLPQLIRAAAGWTARDPVRSIHRLDRDATGVIVFARTIEAQRSLVQQFFERSVEKLYQALVSGYVAADGQVNVPLRFDKNSGRSVVSPRHGKKALTRYRVAQRLAGNTLLECTLVTGRTHQIRAHLAYAGHPLAVDPLYGGGRALLLSNYKSGYRFSARHEERPLIDRLPLHAWKLTFTHPATGERVTFESPLHKDMRATVTQLARALREGSSDRRRR
ncbi:MAG: RluA family pseudouridine synthase [Phycisphaerae bacterium]